MPALSAIASLGDQRDSERIPDLRALSRILYFSAGITKGKRVFGGEMYFRAAACTGALYHIELYLICGNLYDLPAGVYHLGVHDHALRRLRQGDYRRTLIAATAGEPAVAEAPSIIVCTDVFWRNAWKYQSRTYRHAFWDSGTLLANLLTMAEAHQLPARVVAGFVDQEVNRLLGLDTQREVALALVPLGYAPGQSVGPSPTLDPLNLETTPLSRAQVDYPPIRAMHTASCLTSGEEVAAWRGQPPTLELPEPSDPLLRLQPLGDDELPQDAIEEVILRRGSTRRFARDSLPLNHLSTVLYRATRGVPADFLQPPGATLNHLYLIVHTVESLPSGAYVFHRDKGALELLKEGNFREQTGFLGLEQDLPADASVDVFFLSDLRPILERFGNRGYRAAQLEAGIVGGKLYLAAYAHRFGATGLTFYDDEVTNFLSPHAVDRNAMFLIALGRPARRRASPFS